MWKSEQWKIQNPEVLTKDVCWKGVEWKDPAKMVCPGNGSPYIGELQKALCFEKNFKNPCPANLDFGLYCVDQAKSAELNKLPKEWRRDQSFFEMMDPEGFNFAAVPATTGQNNPTKYQLVKDGESQPNVNAYCHKCPENMGYKLTVVSENMNPMVCKCTPSCDMFPFLMPVTNEKMQQVKGYCKLKPSGAGSIVSQKR